MLSREEQMKEWDRVVAMCKGTKFEGQEHNCIKIRVKSGFYVVAAIKPIFETQHHDRIYAIAIVDDTPIWLEEPFRLYTKDRNDLVFVYDEEKQGLVGVTDHQAKPPVLVNLIRVFIPICNVIWENFTLTKPDAVKQPHINTEAITDTNCFSQGNMKDTKQVGGTHYKNKAIQPWVYMEANFTKEEFVGFLRGNAHKYLDRYKDKNGVEDLKKAIHYIEKLIQVESKNGKENY